MSTTFEQVFEITLSFMDEIQTNGTISGDTRDEYEQKALRMITSLQNELMEESRLFSTYEISRTAIDPIRGSFAVFEHKVEDEIQEGDKAANAYYFEVNGPGTVYIEDFTSGWNTLETIVVPSTVDIYTAYKGQVTPTSGASKSRIRFSGSTYYNYRNFALFEESFPDLARVPDYRPWVEYDMPDDFQSVDRIIDEFFPEQYIRNANYKWEGYRTLYLDYDFTGGVRIIYKPVPVSITANTDVMQIDDITATTVLPYGLAATILSSENPDLANYFQQRYDELKRDMAKKPPEAENKVVDLYNRYSGDSNAEGIYSLRGGY